jgi:hypothetical protein
MKIALSVVGFLFPLTLALCANADQWYQDTSGNLHFLSTSDIANGGVRLLPPLATPITPAQADSIRAANATPSPNKSGFVLALKAAMGGILGANALMVAYPSFMQAVTDGYWSDVQTLILDAHTKGLINPTQYTAFQAAVTANHIPVVLP